MDASQQSDLLLRLLASGFLSYRAPLPKEPADGDRPAANPSTGALDLHVIDQSTPLPTRSAHWTRCSNSDTEVAAVPTVRTVDAVYKVDQSRAPVTPHRVDSGISVGSLKSESPSSPHMGDKSESPSVCAVAPIGPIAAEYPVRSGGPEGPHRSPLKQPNVQQMQQLKELKLFLQSQRWQPQPPSLVVCIPLSDGDGTCALPAGSTCSAPSAPPGPIPPGATLFNLSTNQVTSLNNTNKDAVSIDAWALDQQSLRIQTFRLLPGLNPQEGART